MNRLFTVIFLSVYLPAFAQNTVKPPEIVNSFQLTDAATKKAVPSVSVTILRAGLSITTEKDGIFNIGGDLSKMRDTVVFELLGYEPSRIALKDLQGRDTIALLTKIRTVTKPLTLKGEKLLLNEFKTKDVVHYAGLNTATASFDYLQLAQRFDVPAGDAWLAKVVVTRLWFLVDYDSIDDEPPAYVDLEYTTFRLRVYDLEPATGKPGKDLCDQVIEVKSNNSSTIKVNLEDYGIHVSGRSFFIAVEWMRDHRNVGYSKVVDGKTGAEKRTVNYRPAIGVSPVTGSRLNIWALTMKKKWIPYSYFSPEGTDLGIMATVVLKSAL